MGADQHFQRDVIAVITLGQGAEAVLPPFERRVARLFVLGLDDHQIAAVLGRGLRLARRARKRAMRKTGAKTRAELALWAAAHGISPPGDRLSPSERAAIP